jgi:hypothetical protein
MLNGFPVDRLSRLRTEVLRPDVAVWSREDLASSFARRGIASPQDAEDFLGWVNQNIVPRLGNIAARAAQGAAAGSIVPGWGTVLGRLDSAVLGGLTSPVPRQPPRARRSGRRRRRLGSPRPALRVRRAVCWPGFSATRIHRRPSCSGAGTGRAVGATGAVGSATVSHAISHTGPSRKSGEANANGQ